MKYVACVLVIVGGLAVGARAQAPVTPASPEEAALIAFSRVSELEKKIHGLERRLATLEARTAPSPRAARKQARDRYKAVCAEQGLDFAGVELTTKSEPVVRCR